MASMIRALRRLARGESGAELVEFALTLPLLLLLVLGIVEFGFIFREYEIVTNAAREGARIAILPGYSVTEDERKDNAEARVEQYLEAAGLDEALAEIDVADPVAVALAAPATGSVCNVTVDVTYPHTVSFIGGVITLFGGSMDAEIDLRAVSTMRTEAAAAGC